MTAVPTAHIPLIPDHRAMAKIIVVTSGKGGVGKTTSAAAIAIAPASSRIVGKVLKSSGFSTNSATIRMSTEKVIEKARLTSMPHVGSGRMSTTRIDTMPSASTISVRFDRLPRKLVNAAISAVWSSARAGVAGVGVGAGVAGEASAMSVKCLWSIYFS